MGDRMRWGILGTGKIARIIATAVADSRDGIVTAVGSRTGERAEAFATEFDVPRWHPDYAGVLEDDGVDVVYVATHHPAHRELAVRAADAGRHVLCEKPLAVNEAGAAEIVDAARRGGVFLLEAFAYRCHPQTDRLIELVRAGAIGDVRMIDAVFGYDAGPKPDNYLLAPELAGGGILDVGCYTTSMSHLVARAALGVDVAETLDVAAAAEMAPTGVDRSTAASLAFDGGILARVACSIGANLDSAVRITGSEGRIEVPSPWLPGRIGSAATLVVRTWGGREDVIDVPLERDVYTIEVDAVNAAVRDGVRSPSQMPWDESLANMRTLDRWRSAIALRFDDDARD